MSAERLREAARVLRERAEAATPAPWTDTPMGSEGSIVRAGGNTISTARKPATCREFTDAAYIATVHPGFGLAVADHLDHIANLLSAGYGEDTITARTTLAVADAILGGELDHKYGRRS